jgi:hypothetical protein
MSRVAEMYSTAHHKNNKFGRWRGPFIAKCSTDYEGKKTSTFGNQLRSQKGDRKQHQDDSYHPTADCCAQVERRISGAKSPSDKT